MGKLLKKANHRVEIHTSNKRSPKDTEEVLLPLQNILIKTRDISIYIRKNRIREESSGHIYEHIIVAINVLGVTKKTKNNVLIR